MNLKYSFIKDMSELKDVLEKCPGFQFAENIDQLIELACGSAENNYYEVKYDLPENRIVTEATVVRVRNGIAVNYDEPYMRRRDPDCMLIGDEEASDKPKFKDRYGKNFSDLREETFDWLAKQQLAILAFRTGDDKIGNDAIAVVPVNAAFFALALAMLQGILSSEEISNDFSPKSVIYVAPVFRHTHFNGKQVVVHNRSKSVHEIFSYNLYPGPSAKKGVYGVLINQGEKEGWVVPHCSAVQVITPYDNIVTIMHEGASGSGKSEMLEQPHRLPDGRILTGCNIITGEKRFMEIPRTCGLHPVCDDMALCHPSIQKNDGKLWIMDAENGWFLRINHINEYGTDPNLEKLTVQPSKPLFFLNIDAVPDSRALIWEHVDDAPGKPCPNPRVIVPRSIYPDVVTKPVSVDYRSFGVRTPPCTRENPSYGIIGLFHILPPALAWLWRLVAPRGFSSPSIVDDGIMSSEGVGSYWAFSTGLKVNQANLLFEQIERNTQTRYILIPNQHIGAWETGFMPQWLTRDYLARRGSATFRKEQIIDARCSLLGYALKTMRIEGTRIAHWFLEVDTQPEVGKDGYDQGANIIKEFFAENLSGFLNPELTASGRQIIECCLDNGNVEDYLQFFPNYEYFIQND
ncbi:MAG TPA: DUF4914 family protein [Candidatus Marinimicrobia bacterium]|nr:DUF4914 family protein [Candidatus Neomarinimicrobiota bacterium]